MAERNTPRPETAEQLGQQILEFVGHTEFGTAQFQAVSDYFDLREIHQLREENIDKLEDNNEPNPGRESDIRIYEMKIAHLEHLIEQNKSHLSGYSSAYTKIETGFADLLTVSGLEAGQKFSGFEEQGSYIRQMYQITLNGAVEIVSIKKDAA